MTRYQIIKDTVELAKLEEQVSPNNRSGKYPFGELAVGECFRVPIEDAAATFGTKDKKLLLSERKAKLAQRIATVIQYQKKRWPDRRFSYKTIDQGIYVWRIK